MKLILSVVSIIFFVLLFVLLFHSLSFLNKRSFIAYLAYPLSLLLGIWFYKLDTNKSTIKE